MFVFLFEIFFLEYFPQRFLIDKFTGVVTLGKAELDYENVKSYHLTVDATDGGNKKDTTSLYVCINDTNDNAPEFTSSKYEETVKENEEIKIAVQVSCCTCCCCSSCSSSFSFPSSNERTLDSYMEEVSL